LKAVDRIDVPKGAEWVVFEMKAVTLERSVTVANELDDGLAGKRIVTLELCQALAARHHCQSWTVAIFYLPFTSWWRESWRMKQSETTTPTRHPKDKHQPINAKSVATAARSPAEAFSWKYAATGLVRTTAIIHATADSRE